MNMILVAAAVLIVGFFMGLALNWATVLRLRRRVRELRRAVQEGRGPKKMETMKRVIWVCLAMGFAWVWCSYILAYLDKPQIAETLSQVAVTEIIGVVLAYAIKSAVENLSKNNCWPDKSQMPEQFLPDADDKEGME